MAVCVDNGKTLAILWRMPRPKKDPSLIRNEILRVPVSADEKRAILAIAMAGGGEFAGWARTLLLKAVAEIAAGSDSRKKSVSAKKRTA